MRNFPSSGEVFEIICICKHANVFNIEISIVIPSACKVLVKVIQKERIIDERVSEFVLKNIGRENLYDFKCKTTFYISERKLGPPFHIVVPPRTDV